MIAQSCQGAAPFLAGIAVFRSPNFGLKRSIGLAPCQAQLFKNAYRFNDLSR